MSEHDPRFEGWDGAYVLGALDPDDRRDYEDHLLGCARCRADVAELSGLPGLLSRVPTQRAMTLLEDQVDGPQSAGPVRRSEPPPESAPAGEPAPSGEPAPPVDLAARLQRRARQRRRRPLLVAAGAGIAAAVVIIASVLGIRTLNTPTPTLTANLQPTAAVEKSEDLRAQVQLYAKGWGTEIDTRCEHSVPAGVSIPPGTGYGLYVIGTDGRDTLVSSWQGVRQSPITTTAATSTRIEDMQRLELRYLSGQTVLLSAPVRR